MSTHQLPLFDETVARERLGRSTADLPGRGSTSRAPYAPDSNTSKAAAEYITPFTSTLRAQVYAKIFVAGAYGATADEICESLHARRNSIAPRLCELGPGSARYPGMGLICDSGERRKVSGQRVASVVWVVA